MHPRFSIEIDRPRDLVTIVMNGMLMPGDMSDFFKARLKARAMLGCATGRHVTLADLREMNILPHETVDAFGALLTDPQSRARRLAFVVASTHVRSQLMRALVGRDSRCFADPAEAEAWLLEEDIAGREAVLPPPVGVEQVAVPPRRGRVPAAKSSIR
jgi:enoyl-CoA hydratase/carnithine racemase